MINTDSPKPNWPSSRPNSDNILEPTKKKAIRLAKKIPHAALANGSWRACAGVIVPGSVETYLNIATVVASGISNSQPLQNTAAMNICTGTRNRNTRFQNLFLVSQRGCLAGAAVFLVKSSMRTCCNYWLKTYSFIISKLHHVLKAIMQAMVVFLLYMQGTCNAATPVNKRGADHIKSIIAKAEIQNKIPKGLLAAIAKVESGNREYAINVGGRSIYASSLAKALSFAQRKINSGVTNIDLGVMQLNYRWHRNQFASLEEMFTPEKNINYAAKLLKSLYSQHGNWQKAIRHYHSANVKHSSKYSRKVSMVWLSNN